MASQDTPPFFSIIISTRNRPELFQIALRSVSEQSFSDTEIIVVIDGSSEENMVGYREIESQHDDITFYELVHRDNGHGQSYSMNHGVQNSRGRYLCFLDDDDYWTDPEYLASLHASLVACPKPVDVHYSNQKAVHADGKPQTDLVWIEDLISTVRPQDKNHEDSYLVDTDFLLSSGGFAHLNCSVFERSFYDAIGGMDESIRYENDRDMYIRSLDAASVILFSTRHVSLHNIPDVSKKSNMSTVSSRIEKKLFQMRVYDKGISLGKHPSVVRMCCRAKVYELKHAAEILAQGQEYTGAAHYAKAALVSGFNLRWFGYTLYLMFKSRFQSSNGSHQAQQ